MLQKLKEGLRIVKRARRIKKKGFQRYDGSPEKICRQIVNKCWNGTYFQTSAGHFSVFYIRDFAICIPGLLKQGYGEEVVKTLQYAMNIFSTWRKLTTTITPQDIPVHMHHYSPDSLPMLLRSLREAGATELAEIYRPFIEEQVDNYYQKVLDTETGLVRAGKFSSMKDNFQRDSSCYDNCMLAMLSTELDLLKFSNPFRQHDYRRLIKDNFWNGRYFFDDMKKKDYVAGDANTFPFWCGVFDDTKMFRSCLGEIKRAGLDMPWPLKYTGEPVPGAMFPYNILLPDYETDSIWMHLGLCFLDVVKKFDRTQYEHYAKSYREAIEKHKNFLELYNRDGSCFLKRLYASDESMLWAAKYLELNS